MKRGDLDVLAREMRGRTPLTASALLFTIVGVIAATLLWASVTVIDDVTRAPGRVVPAGDIQEVQASEEGVIREVFVSEGQEVAAGDPLIELDALVQTSQLNREIQRARALEARIARLSAEIEGRALVFPADVERDAPELVASEQALHLARSAELAAQIAVLDRQRQQRLQEEEVARIDIRTAERSLAIVTEERDLLAPLVERGIEPQTTLLTLRQREEDLAGRIASGQASLQRVAAALSEIDDTMVAVRSELRSEALADMAEATGELASLRPSLPALESLAARAVLRAPVRGIVNRIHRRTLGGAVRPGEDLVEIVPLDDSLLVEAYVLPQDIAFLQPKQPVRVKISAYDFTRYGSLEGSILRIGANAVRRDERDEGEVFVVTVQTTGAILDADGLQVRILPGMTAEVDILAGERRVIDYLLQPLERVRSRAFRE
ncbi:HlyD family type I secretion periplasmic adaptor subunit [Salipiger marinus]|uniref:Membrane fusion protein (MFP) family protein n=1 Tax=Salipiger marinus TaxID=555512 RepID=A0A1G8V0Q4_9RHOB|nr:HlyD family type I secretion periplasmic adaptor subunit [Salipiger marinus]SDJ59623.1 membrane fusion protein, adhesin transport system [Salipiger marinus]